ncbi:MAG: 3-methyl-2-oxobutanoate dehydrogenase subunit VorB [Erysipelotrichaceae bacterium]|nr:3-methyl-2-oxobutanoate dehydrogenase subunit VorB [Erysipelotrichaceae bacterium]
MGKELMKGSEVVGASAILAGCNYFFGYPITPQNEIPEFMARELPLNNGVFVQAESETAAINMVYGAASSGRRVMTSSSSPGIALKQEGISYCAGAQLPCVIVSVSRAGPGLGGILTSQADYNQATRGGGNGDYNVPVYAPADLQELSELVQHAFYVADKYRNPVMVLIDGTLAQMMEPVELIKITYPEIDHMQWSVTGRKDRKNNHIISSIYLVADELEQHNHWLSKKYEQIVNLEEKAEIYQCEDAEIVVVAYGTSSRIARTSIDNLREKGVRVGMIRPISLWPFPFSAFENLPCCKYCLSVELSMGQMVSDVILASKFKYPVTHFGRVGGNMFTNSELESEILTRMSEVATND